MTQNLHLIELNDSETQVNVRKLKNVLGERLESCSESPLTGFTRSGSCETGPSDLGSHTVCAQVTTEFLQCL